MANSNKDGLAGSIAGELHIGIQGPPGPVGPQGPVGPVGPEATPLTVVISGPVASHSASEIIAAIKAEKIVEVNMGTERLQVTAWDESAVTVTCKKAPAPNRGGALLSCNEYTISDDKTWSVVANSAISTNFTAKSGQVVAVANADPSGPTAFEAIDLREEFIATYGTTTFAEIYNAVSAGKAVYCKNGNVTLPMTAYSAQRISAEFGGVTKDGKVVWKVDNATWSSDVLVDEDKFVAEYGVTTYQEIYDAMQEGKSVYCKNGALEFPMVSYNNKNSTAMFGGIVNGGNLIYKVNIATWTTTTEALGTVKTVNGKAPDARGNVQIETGGGSDYVLPVGGAELGGVKNGGNVVINADGTMTAPESTGNAGSLTVNVSTVSETEAVADKTFVEIKTALSEGREVFVHINGRADALRLDAQDENAITFAKVGTYASEYFAEFNTMKGVFHADGTVLWEEGYTSVPSESTVEQLYVMKPDTAQVGQTIVVDEVDENGRPTHWSAVDLPTGGGGSEEWEHICDIPVVGDADNPVTSISQDLGADYKKVMIILKCEANKITAANTVVRFFFNHNANWCMVARVSNNDTYRTYRIYTELSADDYLVGHVSWVGWYGSGMDGCGDGRAYLNGMKGLRTLYIRSDGSYFLTNTFQVYGVRV